MTTPDERGRDELRERLADAAKFLRRCRGTEPVEFFEEQATACEEAAALLARQEARADDPETDGTDFAHPAYFRGKRDGIRGAVDALERVLDHGRRGGTFGDERLQAFAARLDSLRAVAQDAREPEALRQTIAEAVERLADRLYPYWRSSEGDGSDYLAVANTIDVLAGKLAAPAPETREPVGWLIDMLDDEGNVVSDLAHFPRFVPASEGRPAHGSGFLVRALGYIEGAGAPAPAEATEPPCYCKPGVYTPSADCPRHMRPAEGASHEHP